MANNIYQSLRDYKTGDVIDYIETENNKWYNAVVVENDREFKQITIEDLPDITNETIINYHEIITLNNLKKQTNGKS